MSTDPPLTYRESGVDVAGAERLVDAIGPLVRSTHTPAVVSHPSRFAGLIRPDTAGMEDPLIAATCDGVGTKVLLARSGDDFEALGRDLVAMNVNDLLPLGARPIMFLDYVAAGRLDPARVEAVIRGVAAACLEAGCALVGGETAEMPDLYRSDDLDLAGFAVGLVDGSRLPDSGSMAAGDLVVALPSSGIHANGLTLARRALFDRGGFTLDDEIPVLGQTIGDALLTPTAIYVDRVLALVDRVGVSAAAHVTGGGLSGRAAAMLGDGLAMRIDRAAFDTPPIFGLIAEAGGVSDSEMAATFNMGLGFLAVVRPDDADACVDAGWLLVGRITEGSGEVALGHGGR